MPGESPTSAVARGSGVTEETVKNRRLVRTSIFQQLRADILSCVLRPGSQLQERQLVERFQVSKSPIRDALMKLEEHNLIEVLPRKGYRVKPVSVADARELYELRQLLERECVAGLIENASPDVLSQLDQFRNMKGPLELSAWIAYNRSFHSYLAMHCGNSRLARLAKDVIEQFDRLTYVSVTSRDELKLTDFNAEHGRIIDAIQRRDRRKALALIRDHVESSRRRVLEALENAAVVTGPIGET